MSVTFDRSWIWHPDWIERPNSSSSGAFVDFRKRVYVGDVPFGPVKIKISADTRYQLHINGKFVITGPVKGDEQMWFYDTVDIHEFLRPGDNLISVRVLRFYHGTNYASGFPRTPYGGLFVTFEPGSAAEHSFDLHTDESWETSLDTSTSFTNADQHNIFLHYYERIANGERKTRSWVHAVPYKFLNSFGWSSPWNLRPRMIPCSRLQPQSIVAVHNVNSSVPEKTWEKLLVTKEHGSSSGNIAERSVVLPPGSSHHVELAFKRHTTGFINLSFVRPETAGSILKITYSECYEDDPVDIPSPRVKADRCDHTKKLIGPHDLYTFGGCPALASNLPDHLAEEKTESYSPFHFRTFRFLAIDIEVAGSSQLVLTGIEAQETHYPLEVISSVRVPEKVNLVSCTNDLWRVSLRTLKNCMHDCYEDCPFYEQLQYAMDARSSALFTYSVSRDDRLARQAIIQLHHSFQPALGLTASRAPSHHLQIIPHFSLFWVCMLADHYLYFGDLDFVAQFLPVALAVLETYHRQKDDENGLLRSFSATSPHWDFVDWAPEWPLGVPPAASRTGYQSFTNCLYAYTLRQLSSVLKSLGKHTLAGEQEARANAAVNAVKLHCFDGTFFTDGLASMAEPTDYSEVNQVWAVLAGAASPDEGRKLLPRTLVECQGARWTKASTAMSFYTMRALSVVGGDVYDRHFHDFWDPWRVQLSKNLTTWVEEDTGERSDCHAWGSLPLYDFMAEVAGVKPAAPGWSSISFKPRLLLFKEIQADVALGECLGVAKIRWHRDDRDSKIVVLLTVEAGVNTPADLRVPIQVELPLGRTETFFAPGSLEFQVVDW